jgi:hypothetical protein
MSIILQFEVTCLGLAVLLAGVIMATFGLKPQEIPGFFGELRQLRRDCADIKLDIDRIDKGEQHD